MCHYYYFVDIYTINIKHSYTEYDILNFRLSMIYSILYYWVWYTKCTQSLKIITIVVSISKLLILSTFWLLVHTKNVIFIFNIGTVHWVFFLLCFMITVYSCWPEVASVVTSSRWRRRHPPRRWNSPSRHALLTSSAATDAWHSVPI